MSRILIIEDQIDLAEIISDYLSAEGYQPELNHTGIGIIEHLRANPPDLVLLDVMLPQANGVDICRKIREFSTLPIIMMTAKIDEVDRLLGLNIGADDYICKPVAPKEVVARVKALLRRVSWVMDKPGKARDLHLDEAQHIAEWRGVTLELTPVEFKLLSLLAKRSRVYSRSDLLDVIYDDGRSVNDRTIDSHIKNLRHKLVAVTDIKNPIRSVYGVGYKLELSDNE